MPEITIVSWERTGEYALTNRVIVEHAFDGNNLEYTPPVSTDNTFYIPR